jgi:hypothetical protein
MRKLTLAALAIAIIPASCQMPLRNAQAQGIYMGRDGRAHAQVIVGADGAVFPVVPGPHFAGRLSAQPERRG